MFGRLTEIILNRKPEQVFTSSSVPIPEWYLRLLKLSTKECTCGSDIDNPCTSCKATKVLYNTIDFIYDEVKKYKLDEEGF